MSDPARAATTQAGKADLAVVADDLADAFADDVMFDWLLRTDRRRAQGRLKLFVAVARHVGLRAGRIDRPAEGGAAAIWLPSEAMISTPLTTELRLAPTFVFATGLARFSRLGAFRTLLDRHHPPVPPHAYLMFLGVRREAQGRGLGSRLLRAACGRLDAEGLPAYLETQTERNLGLYRRHGFEVTWSEAPRPDAPTMWGMWREPQEA